MKDSFLDTTLNRDPIYLQLNERLRAVLGRQFKLGDKFLSEREISEQFGVSRTTANKALTSLVSEGLLEFRRGLGTFVQRDLIAYSLQALVSFTDKSIAAGKLPTTKLISFRKIAAKKIDPTVSEALRLSSDARVWEMERLRLADGVPVILEHRYVVFDQCPKLSKHQVTGSLFRAFTKTHGLVVEDADQIIRARSASATESERLDVAVHSPVLEVVAIGYVKGDSPLWWERSLYRGDQYEFHSRLGPIAAQIPARGQLR